MAKKNEASSKKAPPAESSSGRVIKLGKRPVTVTNLNFSPEKAGQALVEKCDLTIQLLLKQGDLDLFLETNGAPASSQLYDQEGNLMFPEISSFPVNLQVEGSCVFAPKGSKKGLEFADAVLKKPHIELLFGREAALKAQIRVAPGGHLDQLGKLVIERAATFSFNGAATQDEDSDDQEDLPL